MISLLAVLLGASDETAWGAERERPVAPLAGRKPLRSSPRARAVSIVAWGPHARLVTRHSLWDLERGVIIAELRPESESASWCGDVLLTLSAGGLFWRDGASGAVVATAAPFTRPSEVVCSPDGRFVLAFGEGAEVWDVATRTGRKLGSDWVGWAAWGPHDRVALAVHEALEIWRLDRAEPVREQRRSDWTGVLAWSRDGVLAADIRAFRQRRGIDETGLVELRPPRLNPGRWLTSCYPDPLDHCPVEAAAWSPDGRWLAATVAVWLQVVEVRGKLVRPVRVPTDRMRAPRAISWSPDGRALASADLEGVVLLRIRDRATIRLREEEDVNGISGIVEPNALSEFLDSRR